MVFSAIVKLSEVTQPEITISPGWWQVIVSILLPSIPSIVIMAFISGRLWAKITATLKLHGDKIDEICCQIDPEDKTSVLVTKGECLATKSELLTINNEVKILITDVKNELHSRLNRLDKSREDAWAHHNNLMTDLVAEVGSILFGIVGLIGHFWPDSGCTPMEVNTAMNWIASGWMAIAGRSTVQKLIDK